MTHDQFIKLLQERIKGQMTKSVLDILLKKFAFLSWGLLAPLLEKFLNYVFSLAVDKTELKVYLEYTDFRVTKQGNEFHQALITNQIAQKEGSDEQKKAAENGLKTALLNLISLRK